MRALGLVLLVLVAACAPLLAPGAWVHAGALPDVAVVVVVYVALRSDADHAALLGLTIGAVAGCFSVEPFLQQAFLLGATGYVVGRMRRGFLRERRLVQVAFVALAVLTVRCADAAAAEFVLGRSAEATRAAVWSVSAFDGASRARDAAMSRIHGFDVVHVLSASLVSAALSALAAPLLFAAIRSSRVLAPFEQRVARRV